MRGRSQQRLKRIIQTGIAFVKNSVIPVQLPRNYDIETLFISIRGSLVSPVTAFVTGSNGFTPAIRFDAPYGLIPRVEVILEGRQTVFSVPMRMLGMANMWRRRPYYFITNVDTFNETQTPPLVRNAATGSSVIAINTTYAFKGTVAIDFQCLKGLRPKDTNVRSGGLQTFDLRLTTSDETGLYYQPSSSQLTTPFTAPAIGATLGANSGGATSLGNLSGVTIDVYAQELEELRDSKGGLSSPGYVQRWINQTVPVPAASGQQEVLVPTDNFIGAIIVAPTIGNEASDIVVTNVIARRGTDQRFSLPANDLRAINEVDYERQCFPGFYVCDFMNSGGVNTKISDAWNVQGGADTRLVLSTANPGNNVNVDVLTIEFIPISAA